VICPLCEMAIYSDIKQSSGLSPLVYDIDAIVQAIWNLISTKKMERLFLPEFGVNLEGLLFEPMSEDIALQIYSRVFSGINRWDPRVVLVQNLCNVTPYYDEHYYDVTLALSIVGLGDQVFQVKGVLEVFR